MDSDDEDADEDDSLVKELSHLLRDLIKTVGRCKLDPSLKAPPGFKV